MLKTSKNITVLDVETTGTDKKVDRIIQISMLKIDTEHHKIVAKMNEYVRPDTSYTIGIGAFLKHGVKPAMLADKPTFRELADKIIEFLGTDDILTYNGISFDLQMLVSEFARCGKTFLPKNYRLLDAYKEELRRNSNKLEEVYRRYCGKTMEEAGLKAHDALSDVKATYAIWKHQQDTGECRYEDLLVDDDSIKYVEFNGKQEAAFSFGKYRDVPLPIVCQADPEYINWFLSKNDVCASARSLVINVYNLVKEGSTAK
jgi:DNA polymerase-3 subunit epsilon